MSDHLTASSTPETHPCSDDHYYQLQSERSRILSEKVALEKVHQVLLEEHRVIQSQLDDAVSERDEALSRTRELQKQADSRRSDKADVMMRAEIDRLRAELYVSFPKYVSSSSRRNLPISGRRVRRT